MIKIIGQGIYKDSYLGSVLLLGNDRFGLFLVADINQVSKGFLLTEQYVYDAKFLPGGRIAYITRPEEVRDNRFQLTICAADGEVLQRLSISGSGLLLSPDGRYGCVSGPGAEVIDLDEARLLSQAQAVSADIDGQLLAALRGASLLYMRQALGQPVDEAGLSAYFVDDDRVGMAYSEMLARQSEAAADSAPVFYQALLDRQHSLIAVGGDVATCHLRLSAQVKGGAAYTEQVAWDLLKSDGQWRVAGLATFCQESGRAAFLQEAEQILREQGLWPEEGPRWRQVQYWQRDKVALAAWLDEAAWVKIDGEPGGLVLWLTKGEQGQWQLAQLWYNGGWVYPAPAP